VAGNQTKQSELIASLLRPEAYPHPVATLELIETHISWVILTGTFVWTSAHCNNADIFVRRN
jgi:aminoglycoside phosphotransferase family enzyme